VLQLADVPISAQTRAQLIDVAGDVHPTEAALLRDRLPAAAARARAVSGHWDFAAPANALDSLLLNQGVFPEAVSESGRDRMRRAAVARCVLEHFRVDDRMPASVVSLYEEFWSRLGTFLTTAAPEGYDDDYFAKDVRYALGLTVPCGALQIDLSYSVGPKLILRDIRASRSLAAASAYLRARGWGRWYNDHLDLRDMSEFTPAGWTACFARFAEVLALNPTVRGVTGISWFYDPKVAEISPRLAYVQVTQTENGAFLANMGTDAHHVENATVRSPIRRRLYEEGKYLPTCYLLAWPRGPLLRWAERLPGDPALAFGGAEGAVPRRRRPPAAALNGGAETRQFAQVDAPASAEAQARL
jgi:hypothetical protein